MVRRVIGGQVPESPGTLVVQTRDFDSPAKQLDDSNANFEELYAASGLSDEAAAVQIGLPAGNTDDLDLGGGNFDGVHFIDFMPVIDDATVTGMLAGTDGQRILGYNAGTKMLNFPVEDSGSSAINRFTGIAGTVSAFFPGEGFWLVYRHTFERWLVI